MEGCRPRIAIAIATVIAITSAPTAHAASPSLATQHAGAVSGSIGAGADHSCAIKTDGTLACWGQNTGGKATPPAGTYTQLAVGGNHNCAVKTDGTLACWGSGAAATPPSTTDTYKQVAAGTQNSCAIKTDGSLACWGSDAVSQVTNTPTTGTYNEIALGSNHICALKTDGTLTCWGSNTNGRATPPAGTYTHVAAGFSHTCAIKTDGTLACWGDDSFNQVGTMPTTGTYSEISALLLHTCAIKTDGTLACWGENTGGKATPPAGTYTEVTAGDGHSCAIKTDGTLGCWGASGFGAATPPAGRFSRPAVGAGSHSCAIRTVGLLACWGNNQATPPAGTYTQIAAGGAAHDCALKTDGTLGCWGDNNLNQASPPAGTFTDVATGLNHGCAIKTDGTLACWGFNGGGQASPPAGTYTRVAAAGAHSCAIKTDGTLACWGQNTDGKATPPAGTYTHLAASSNQACAIKIDGTLACWGAIAAPPAGTYTQVASGFGHSCAIKTDGTLACWGDNTDGKATPPAGTYTQLAAGGSHSCAVRSDGTLACWGNNSNGGLGGAPTITSPAPAGETVGNSYSHNYVAGPSAGPSATFAVTAGSLPPALALSSAGALTGTPTTPGTYTGTVTATNDLFAPDATQAFSITIAQATPSLGASASAGGVIGTAVHDTATLGSGHNPTGQITYNLYGPDDASCSNPAAFTDTDSVSGNGAYLSANFTPTTAGTYRWVAAYSGDADNQSASGACNDSSQSVTIAKAPASLGASASAGGVIGTSIHDTATLSSGHNPGGQIAYSLYGPGDSTCANAPTFTDTKPVSGNSAYDSASFTPTTAGTYRWAASYSGDANNEADGSACGDAGQSVDIGKAAPTLTAAASAGTIVGEPILDSATLAGGHSAGGQITFSLYGPRDSTCANAPIFTDTKAVSGNGSHESGAFTPTEPGTYLWVAAYSGDANNEGSAGACGGAGQSSQVAPKPPKLQIVSVELDRKHGTAMLNITGNRDGEARVEQTKRIIGTEPIRVGADLEAQVKVKTYGKAARRLRHRGELEVNPRVLLATPDGGRTGERERFELVLDGR